MPATNTVSQEDHQAALDRIAALELQLGEKPQVPAGTSEQPLHMRVLPETPAEIKPFDPAAHGYEGSFTERATGRKYARKVVALDDKPHRLFTTDHGKDGRNIAPLYHELSEADFRNLFDKD